ncbi:hypothetical protein BH09ACT2_BH09ACT2_09220 [soil metagenome]
MSTATRGTRALSAIGADRRDLADSVTFLTGYLVILYAIPSNRSIHALGSAGSVAVVWGLAGVLVWGLFRMLRSSRSVRAERSPLRLAVFIFLLACLGSYVAAMTRALPGTEVSTADTGMIRLVAWAGILLIASDGIPDMRRFMILLHRSVIAGTVLAVLGITQFITKLSIVDLIPIPGLTVGSSYSTLETRGGILRPSGTSNHPLEFGLILAMVFPVALTLALQEKKTAPVLRWLPPVLIVFALLVSGSRSSIIGLIAGAIVLIPTWSRSVRWGFAISTVAMVGVAYAVSPRAITTLRYLFVSIANDPSAASRAQSQGIVVDFFRRNPAFGRGFGTFLPEYRILDNQYFLLLIEVGLVGTLLFASMLLTAALSAGMATRRYADPVHQNVGFALVGSVVAGGILLALFDGLSFPQAAGTLFFFVGMCGAYWRLAGRENVLKNSVNRPMFES